MRGIRLRLPLLLLLLAHAGANAEYVNFESSHVHPIALTPSGGRLLAVNTPDAMLEVFAVQQDGSLVAEPAVPVGLEPVSVVARGDDEAWVVNLLSDSVSVVDLAQGVVVRTLRVGDEPTDVAFANGRAFVSVATEDAIKVFDLADLSAAPSIVPVFGRKPRALAVSADESRVYAVVQLSGNQTTIVGTAAVWGSPFGDLQDPNRLEELGLFPVECDGAPPAYPPLPPGIARNPDLTFPASGIPEVSLIVGWNRQTGRWEDEAGQNWNRCLPFRMPDHDLFVIDTTSLAVTEVDHLGTTLFDVSVHPKSGKIYVPHTEARNLVRFEHPLGVRGHMVDNRMAIIDPSDGFSSTIVDLNAHIDRNSDPATNVAERWASISQPGMLVWSKDGTGYLTAIGSRKLFRLDSACTSGNCVFGPNRAAPAAVEVGEGPTGVALHEATNRAYVLNRFSNSIAIVDTTTLTRIAELPLHDPGSPTIVQGRRLLYDAIIGSGHGDAACASCHISGDRDGLAWDLGDPGGDLVAYDTPFDNVRFITPNGNAPANCNPGACNAYSGFDPQKGPMVTQTLRGMLEPLHWRGDRPTMRDFNTAFVTLMGTADIGPVDGKPAGLPAEDMERLRAFALGIRFPPNPYRNADDSLPNTDVPVPGDLFAGNPTRGREIFDDRPFTDGGGKCVACHTRPFGAGGGTLGGIEPAEPTSLAAAALFNGFQDLSLHSDLKVPHLRNMYEKFGPRFGDGSAPHPAATSGFGYGHDGNFSTLGAFFSDIAFDLSSRDVRDVSAFMMHFPTGTKPAVGQHLTVPAGTPPTGSAADEALLATLMSVADRTDFSRDADLVAATRMDGRLRRFHLDAGKWTTDVRGRPQLTTTELRERAEAPISFLGGTVGSAARLGGDRDQDGFRDGDDCAAADPGAWSVPDTVTGLTIAHATTTQLGWDEQASSSGPGVRYDVLGGSLADLRYAGLSASIDCRAGGLSDPSYTDTRSAPAPGTGEFTLVLAINACGVGRPGPGRPVLDDRVCEVP